MSTRHHPRLLLINTIDNATKTQYELKRNGPVWSTTKVQAARNECLDIHSMTNIISIERGMCIQNEYLSQSIIHALWNLLLRYP